MQIWSHQIIQRTYALYGGNHVNDIDKFPLFLVGMSAKHLSHNCRISFCLKHIFLTLRASTYMKIIMNLAWCEMQLVTFIHLRGTMLDNL